MPDYICPGCQKNDMADECWHDQRTWELAQAIAIGLPAGAATWGTEVDRAWAFIDDADALNGRVGEPPYTVVSFHPDTMEPYTTIGLINGRYLWAMPNGEGDCTAELIGDCGARVTINPNGGR